MFGDIKRLIGNITVVESAENVTIEGLPADIIERDIAKIWQTSRINKNMFVTTTRSKIVIPKFFLIEFIYALNTIERDVRSYTSRGAIKRIVQLLETETWVAKQEAKPSILNFDRLKEFNATPKDHQLAFLRQYDTMVPKMQLNGYILAAAAGSGKSLSGLMLARCLEVDCMIVVCPKNAVREVWPDNVNRFSKQPKTMWVSDTAEEPRAGLDYYFCHYEALPRLLAVAPKIFKNRRVMIDLDECHNFNDPDSLRSKQFFELCKLTMAEHIVWASGTPFKAMAKEMIGFLKTCDPFFNNKVEERFKAIFGISVGRAADILSHRLGLVSYKVDKKHVMGDTDPIVETINVKIKDGERFTLDNIRTEMVRFINDRLKYYKENRQVYLDIFYKTLEDYENSKLNQAQLEAYKQYLKDVKAIQSTTDYRQVALEMRRANAFEKEVIMPRLSGKALADFRKAKGVVKYVSLVIRGEALGGILGRRRIECHTELVKHIPYGDIIDNAEKKTLIFSSYVEVVDVMQQELSKLGYNPLLVYGDTNKNLDSILRKFDTDPKANPLVATLQSLSTAVPVLSANTVVFTNSPFRVHERTQAISRVHRLGQDTQTYVFDILLDTGGSVNISTRSLDIMQWSADQVDLLLGKVGDVSLEELDVESIKD